MSVKEREEGEGTDPDLLFVSRRNGQTEVHVSVSPGNTAVFGLTVHPHARLGDTEERGDARVRAVIRVTCFDGLAEGGECEGSVGHMNRREGGGGEGSLEEVERSVRREGRRRMGRTWKAPWPLTATKSTPFSPSGLVMSTGRLGHPMTPTTTSPSTKSPRQTAYCPPRRNPLVPSMGSSAQ